MIWSETLLKFGTAYRIFDERLNLAHEQYQAYALEISIELRHTDSNGIIFFNFYKMAKTIFLAIGHNWGKNSKTSPPDQGASGNKTTEAKEVKKIVDAIMSK